ncbi:uncharacterized protein METZ01_LOCUS119115 [marine metagenome]|uniref:Uncharacterized protein n=1 Tax=marine metagenome TaxID=408172 RepID=A0A381XPC7_9ZZZZ
MNMITEQALIANRRTSNFRAILVIDRRFMRPVGTALTTDERIRYGNRCASHPVSEPTRPIEGPIGKLA